MTAPVRVRIAIEDALDEAQRQELVEKLEHEPGIACVYYPATTPHVMVLEYAPQHFSPATLLDLVSLHGVSARLL